MLRLRHTLIKQKMKLTFSTSVKKKLKIKGHSTGVHFVFQ